MLKNTFPYLNNRHVSHIRQLPHILKINLHTKLDDGKDPKSKIDDKTKDELKKDLKCEIDDKTKNEIKDKIKKEIEDEIDCKLDKNGHDKGGKGEKGFNKDGDDKDGFDKDEDGKKDRGDKDEDGDDAVIEGTIIGLSHTEEDTCGVNSRKYLDEGQVGKPAWFTRDLLKQFLPDLMENEKIMDRFKSTYSDQYHAENFGITFKCEEDEECGKNVNFTLAAPSNMWCNKAGAKGTADLQCREEIRSISKSSCCLSAVPYSSPINSENFFLNDKCPNLILDLPSAKLKECVGKIIVAKLEAPMVIVAKDDSVVDKNNYKIHEPKYLMLKDKLNYKGEIKDSAGKSPEKLEEVKESIDRGLWISDKEVKLKIPDMPSYSPGANYDEDETFLYFDNEGKYEEEVLQAKAEAEKLKIQVQKDGYDEDGFNKDGFNEKGYHRSDKEVLLKSAFSHSTQEANLNYYDNEDNSVSVDTNFI